MEELRSKAHEHPNLHICNFRPKWYSRLKSAGLKSWYIKYSDQKSAQVGLLTLPKTPWIMEDELMMFSSDFYKSEEWDANPATSVFIIHMPKR